MTHPPDWINADAVRLLVGGMLGKQVAAKAGTAVAPSPRTVLAVAEYKTDADAVGGLVLCDLPLAASLGAALILMPANVANDAVKVNKLPENLADNAREIFNVGARWFNAPLRPHVRLSAVYWNQAAMPPAVAEFARKATGRLDVNLAIPGYTPGNLSVLVAA